MKFSKTQQLSGIFNMILNKVKGGYVPPFFYFCKI